MDGVCIDQKEKVDDFHAKEQQREHLLLPGCRVAGA